MEMKTIHICYPEGRHKALTFSYDDGRADDCRLVDIFNRYQLKATFHLNSGFLHPEKAQFHKDRIYASTIRSVYRGHEIASHTVTHPTIARTPIDHVAKQILDDRAGLEAIVGYPVRGFSYPNGSYTNEIKNMLPYLGIDYARTVGSSYSFELPTDLYTWKMTCHHNKDLLSLGKKFKQLSKSQYLYCMSVWGHSFEFSRDNNWELIEQFCEELGGESTIWYATNIEIIRYMKAAQMLQISIDERSAYNPSALTIWLTVGERLMQVPPGQTVDLDPVVNIHLIGDSTVQSYQDISDYQGGWGEYLSDFFCTNFKVYNHAIGGRSSRSFIQEGRLKEASKKIQAGDIVCVQMGHNDASADKPERYTEPSTTYIEYINQYVETIRKKGALPILCTPVPTYHLESDQYINDFEAYTDALKRYAKEEKVICVDLMSILQKEFAKKDKEEVAKYYLLSLGMDDRVHFTKLGAKVLAEIISLQLAKHHSLLQQCHLYKQI